MEKKLPSAYRTFAAEHPRIIQAYEQLGDACLTEGPLDRKQAELVKVGILHQHAAGNILEDPFLRAVRDLD